MIVALILKAFRTARDVCVEAFALRQALARRYPGVEAE